MFKLVVFYTSCIIWSAITLFFLLFTIYAKKDGEKRPFLRSLILLVLSLTILGVQIFLEGFYVQLFQYITLALFLLFALISAIPYRNTHTLKIYPSKERFDERDVMFARGEYRPGTKKYRIYYGELHPEKKEFDDRLRELPEPCEGGAFYDRLLSSICCSEFSFISKLLEYVDGGIEGDMVELTPEEFTEHIKWFTKYLGADLVGIAPVEERYFYSHVGRGPEEWGREIKVEHKYAISFAVEMDYMMLSHAPRIHTTVESAKKYVEVAVIAIILAEYIRRLGYSARAHISESNYQAILPPFAYLAGIGELGRLGYIITREFGPRVRLGLVTTNLPLITDKPISFGVQDMCSFCTKCADNCPAQAIPSGEKTVVRGVEKWQLDYEKCYYYWKKIGTDCGLCMYTCPYSRGTNPLQNLLRRFSTLSHFARRFYLWWDDFFYGKYPRRIII